MITRKIDKPDIDQAEICDSLPGFPMEYRQRVLDNSADYEANLDDICDLLASEKELMRSDKQYKDKMIAMYDKMSSNRYSAYRYYDQIRRMQKSCPYCNYFARTVRQLDHYLPKTVFPSLAVTPLNLVPICADCNELKKAYYSEDKGEMLIHPYFDEFANEVFEFLKCSVIEDDNIGFVFYIQRLDHWDDSTFSRVKLHFEKLKISELYRTAFEDDFDAHIEGLMYVFDSIGFVGCKEMIKKMCNSFVEKKRTPWLYAGYNSLLNSECFFAYLKRRCEKAITE